MASVCACIIMEGSMREVGFLTSGTVKVMSDLVTETAIWAIIKMEKFMEKGFIVGMIKRRMMVSGAMVLSTVMEFGKEARETRMSDSGSRTKHMDTEFTSGQTVTNTRASGTNVFATAKALTDLQMATASLGITHSEKLTAPASIVGQTETSTVAFSKTT
jgi:hypothetical protein